MGRAVPTLPTSPQHCPGLGRLQPQPALIVPRGERGRVPPTERQQAPGHAAPRPHRRGTGHHRRLGGEPGGRWVPGVGGSAQQLGGGWAWWQPLSISLTHPEHDGGEVGLGASRPAAELPAELHPVPQPAPAVPGPPGTADPAAGRGAEPPPPSGSSLQLPGSGEYPRWTGRVLSR